MRGPKSLEEIASDKIAELILKGQKGSKEDLDLAKHYMSEVSKGGQRTLGMVVEKVFYNSRSVLEGNQESVVKKSLVNFLCENGFGTYLLSSISFMIKERDLNLLRKEKPFDISDLEKTMKIALDGILAKKIKINLEDSPDCGENVVNIVHGITRVFNQAGYKKDIIKVFLKNLGLDDSSMALFSVAYPKAYEKIQDLKLKGDPYQQGAAKKFIEYCAPSATPELHESSAGSGEALDQRNSSKGKDHNH